MLLHPEPPPVVCIEEPEIGLHPDVIPEVAKLLVEASSRSQIFVTTHSDVLVDALTETPESIVVCEKSAGATRLRRLDKAELEPWLDAIPARRALDTRRYRRQPVVSITLYVEGGGNSKIFENGVPAKVFGLSSRRRVWVK